MVVISCFENLCDFYYSFFSLHLWSSFQWEPRIRLLLVTKERKILVPEYVPLPLVPDATCRYRREDTIWLNSHCTVFDFKALNDSRKPVGTCLRLVPPKNDRMAGGRCFSWRMCLSSQLRLVITTNLYQAGETVAEGKYPIMLFISSLGSITVNILSNKVVLGKRQPLSTLPCRTMMYFTSNRHCLNFISICAENNQESDIAMYYFWGSWTQTLRNVMK